MSTYEFKGSELINRLILSYQTTEDLGKLKELFLDIEQHKVQGFVSKSGLLGRQKRSFLWSQIETIGKDSILVNSDVETEINLPDSLKSLIGFELWTDTGTQVGVVTDYLINSEDGKITGYLFTSNGLRGITDGVYCLGPQNIISIGSKRLIVNNEAVENAQQYAEGLGKTISKVADFIKEDYEKTMEDLTVVKENAQTLASQTTEKLQEITIKSSTEEEKKSSHD